MHRWSVALALVFVLACDEGTESPDGGTDGVCASAADCSDGVFCNGSEVCDPDHPSADENGCLVSSPPCMPSQTCDEASASCVTECDVDADADDDGVDAIRCGGTDCDDSNADRFPGNTEVCDEAGVDEDCDLETLGPDMDEDGFVDAACCNVADGRLLCGTDCDDDRASVAPGGTEVCNGSDEDCDGDVDEGVFETAYPDFDGDGFGNGAAARERACDGDPLFTDAAGDCDDTNPAVNPGAEEVCDGFDNDCDGDLTDEIDVDRDGFYDAASTCTGVGTPDCDDLSPTTFPGAPEQCNDIDDNCDGTTDEREVTTGVGADAYCAGILDDATGFCGDLGPEHACVVAACPADRGDCDGNPRNGCEASFLDDPLNCGGCDVRCNGVCSQGICEIAPNGAVLDLALGGSGGGCVLREETPGSGQGWIGCWGEIWFVPFGPRPLPIVDASGDRITDAVAVTASRNGLHWIDAAGALWSIGTDPSAPGARLAAGFPSGVTQIASADFGVCAIAGSGELWCQEDDLDLFPAGSETPTQRYASESFVDVSVGQTHACAINTLGQLRCWGDNDERQVGPDTTGPEEALLDPRTGSFQHVAAGEAVTCAQDGTGVLCWGNVAPDPFRDEGSFNFARVPFADAWDLVSGSVGELDAGAGFGCAQVGDGVECWGDYLWGSGSGVVCGPDAVELVGFCDASVGLECNASRCQHPFSALSSTLPSLPVRSPAVDDALAEMPPLRTLTNVTQLEVSERWACAVLDDEEVVCWGRNIQDPLAVAASYDLVALPLPQRRSSPIAEVALGRWGGCGLRADGSSACWGRADYGQLGRALPGDYFAPGQATLAPTDLRDLSVGEQVSCGVRSDGTVSCWGGLGSGADLVRPLGDGSTWNDGSATPVTVSGLADVRAVSVALEHACALVGSGEVWCWGSNAEGALGNAAAATDDCAGTDDCALTPVQVSLPAPAAEIGTGGIRTGENTRLSFGSYSCARLVDGRVWCWGASGGGGLGLGPSAVGTIDAPVVVEPTEVPGVAEVVDIGVSSSHVCAVRADGRVICWGADLVGTGGPPDVCVLGLPCQTSPYLVPVLEGAREIEVGLATSCALRDDDIVCWGNNTQGLVGDGSTAPRAVPGSSVALPAAPRSVAFRHEIGCAVLVTDEVYCWGREQTGNRGDGPQVFSAAERNPLLPSEVPGF